MDTFINENIFQENEFFRALRKLNKTFTYFN